MKVPLMCGICVLLICPRGESGEFKIDLAKRTAGDSVTLPAGTGEITKIRIVNRIPAVPYTVEVRTDTTPIAPLSAIPIPTSYRLQHARGCAAVVLSAKELRDPTKTWTEATVGGRVADVESRLEGCTEAQIAEINEELDHTRLAVSGPYPIPRGGRISVVISRPEGSDTITWTTILEGPSRGRWLTTYGIAAVEDKDETFFSEAEVGAGGEFTVTQESAPGGSKAIPSVYFMWLPGEKEAADFSHGPTAGFGIKSDRPSFFFGYSVLYNWNLGLVVGGALVSETRLKGQYTEGQTLSENLTQDALNTHTYRIRFSVALVFRFGGNPFGGSDSTDAKPKPTGDGESR